MRPMNGRSKARITDLGVFAALEPADRKWLLKTARPMTFPVGATLQEAGSVDRRVFVVIEGMVRLDSGSTHADVGPGTAFGDARSSGEALPVTATALTDVRTYIVPSLAMAWLAQHYPHVALWLKRESTEISLAG